ncbi:MAG: enoyl-CoA hydratase-related protein [Gemmobacter sp.]|nr:enoyl-CoA hydratase-related protein [Gemmobacter sp.]
MTDASLILVDRTPDGVTRLTMNDPDRRNALSLPLRSALRMILRAEAGAPETRALVLTGAGVGFCAGGDISAMGLDPVAALQRFEIMHDIARELAMYPKPVVAAVNGAAFGAGFSLALLADYVIAAPGAKFGVSFARMGLVPDTAFLWAVQRRVSRARALQMVAGAEILTADAALSEGIVDALADDPVTAAEQKARALLKLPPLPFAAAKRALARADGQLETLLAAEYADQARMFNTNDHREAVAAFREKRDPVFNGT